MKKVMISLSLLLAIGTLPHQIQAKDIFSSITQVLNASLNLLIGSQPTLLELEKRFALIQKEFGKAAQVAEEELLGQYTVVDVVKAYNKEVRKEAKAALLNLSMMYEEEERAKIEARIDSTFATPYLFFEKELNSARIELGHIKHICKARIESSEEERAAYQVLYEQISTFKHQLKLFHSLLVDSYEYQTERFNGQAQAAMIALGALALISYGYIDTHTMNQMAAIAPPSLTLS